jgi:hypothetical protein
LQFKSNRSLSSSEEIWGSHRDDNEEYCLLECDAV